MTPFLDEKAREAHRHRNFLHSLVLSIAITILLAMATAILWGPIGVALTLITLFLLFIGSPRLPPSAIMALYRARHVPQDESQLSSLVDVLAYRAELKHRPKLYVIPSMTLNAFATGTPDQSAIAVTEGLLRRLSLRETAGVLAHEMSHIRNNDLWIMGLADVATRFLQLLSYVALALAILNILAIFTNGETVSWLAILLLYLAPAISSLLQLGLSRTREFDADLEAAGLTGDPEGLAMALDKLETYTGRFWEDLMFPVPARRIPQPSLLRSHPPTADRITRLEQFGGQIHSEPLKIVEQPMMTLVGYGPGEMRPRYRWPGLWY
jgi:heat shock protein HtpX